MTDAHAEPVVLRDGGCDVEIRRVRRGATTSVRIEDARSGAAITLDATELESLARAPEHVLRDLLGRHLR